LTVDQWLKTGTVGKRRTTELDSDPIPEHVNEFQSSSRKSQEKKLTQMLNHQYRNRLSVSSDLNPDFTKIK